MKFRIIEWRTGSGKKYFTVQVKKYFSWHYISMCSAAIYTHEIKFDTRDDALKAIDSHMTYQVKKIKTEYIVKDL